MLLLALALLLFGARPAHAGTGCNATYGGTINGYLNPTPPSLLQIDGNCTIENFPASNPYGGSISWLSVVNTLLIFNNVDFVGNLSCDSVPHNDFVWFVNGSITRQHILKCSNLFAAVDKIDKQTPAGQTTAAIGVPFTYTLTFPQLYDPLSGRVINAGGSNRDVSQVTVTDNLNATGVSLNYLSSTATWKGSGAAVPFTVTNAGGLLTFSGFPTIPAGQQIVLKVTVVLNNAVPPNSPGTQFFNTANWTLGTTIGGIFHYPLPGQQGVSPPLTIAAPNLVMTKTGPATMNLGQLGQFGLDIQNTGNADAWNVTLQDRLPSGATGGMCATTPQILSAQVTGKGALTLNTDYTVSYSGAPNCTLTLNMLTPAAVIGPGQHLIVTYQTQLDPNSQNGAQLTNVAGATQWFSAPSSSTGRQAFTCTLTNGTPGVADCQDAHTVTVALSAVTITKQVSVVGGGPALPGAQLDYLVHVTNTSTKPVNPVVITDDLNAAGAGVLTYVAGSATMNGSATGVSVAGNVITANFSATYGALQPGKTIDLHFLATIGSGVAAGTTVTNTGVVTWNTPPQNASGSASIQVVTPPSLLMTKGGPATMNIGQPGLFTLNVQNTGTSDAWNVTLQDRLPVGATGGMCTTPPQIQSAQVFQADGVTPVPGKGPLALNTDYTVTYVAAPTCTLTLNLLTPAAVIGSTQRLIITYRTQLDANSQNGAQLTNVAGATQWFSAPSSSTGRQTFTCTLTNGTPGVADCQDAHTVTVAISTVTITKQVSVVGGGAAVPGAQLDYLVHVSNPSPNPATNVVITDDLNAAGAGVLTYVAGSATMNSSATGVTVAGNIITANYSATYGPLLPGKTIDLHFRATIGAGVAPGTTITNAAVVTWNNPQQSAAASASIQTPKPPTLVMTKGGPVTMNIGQPGRFTLNVQNTGTIDAWNVTLQDRLPSGATGGMCTATPQILSAQVFQADGVTPAPGKVPLSAGSDYTVTYSAAPACTLTLTALTPAAVIGASQRLIVVYQTQLDANSRNGAKLTNVAGATQWYNGPASNTGRLTFSCKLTDGTPGIADCQDAHTVTVAISIVNITKQVSVVGGGAPLPGTQLDYLVHVTNGSPNPATNVVITDNLNAAGPGVLSYVAGTATMNGSANGVSVTGNIVTANYSATYGPLAPGGTIDLRFRATLGSPLAAGTSVTNTGVVTWNNPPQSASGSVSIQVASIPAGALTITKTTSLLDVTRGQLVPYTITLTNVLGGVVQGVTLIDRFPAGFRYVKGSARIDNTPAEPAVNGLQLTWSNLNFGSGGHHSIVLLLAVGAGVGEGEFVNRAQAFAGVGGNPISGVATATVRVVPDLTFDCTDVIGKVFDDVNGNGHQDPGEKGLPGVRVITTRGLAAVTDQYGRFHITCAITPLEGRGSNFALKLDERTLPSGYRSTTPQVLVERATRGKALRYEFGASIHRVVSLDLSDAAFEPGGVDLRLQWQPRIELLLAELRKGRSVLHLSYLADVEEPLLVERRLQGVAESIQHAWQTSKCCYELNIEREIFWLRGSPPREPVERLGGPR